MLNSLKELFRSSLDEATEKNRNSADPEHGYRLATATLLFEASRADFEVSANERAAIGEAIRNAFELPEHEIHTLLTEAEAEADAAISLHQYTSIINERLNPGQKFHLVQLLWKVAYVDGQLDKYEDHIIRKISELIYVPHREFIRAKLSVIEHPGASG